MAVPRPGTCHLCQPRHRLAGYRRARRGSVLRHQRVPDRFHPVRRIQEDRRHRLHPLLCPPLHAPDPGVRGGDAHGFVFPRRPPFRACMGERPVHQQFPAHQGTVRGMVLVAGYRGAVLPDLPGLHHAVHGPGQGSPAHSRRTHGAFTGHPLQRDPCRGHHATIPDHARRSAFLPVLRHHLRQAMDALWRPAGRCHRRFSQHLPCRADQAVFLAHLAGHRHRHLVPGRDGHHRLHALHLGHVQPHADAGTGTVVDLAS